MSQSVHASETGSSAARSSESVVDGMQQAKELLRTRFGFSDFRPGQAEVVEHLLAGRSAAAVFPTGGGKSLCYQLPALVLPGVTLVVSPLIALMKDQIDGLQERGIDAVRLDSTLDADDYREALERIRAGDCKLLYVSPERFQNERFRGFAEQLHVSLFAVDEAHCISEWGHSFRPDYLKLARFAQHCRAERRFALTATATSQVLSDICAAFDIAPNCAVRTPFYRENLELQVTPTTADDRNNALSSTLKNRPRGATIVYVTLQKTAEQVAALLASQGLPARAYHAGMKPEQRSDTQEWFVNEAEPIIVATIAFGMGIDKSDIRYVYHYNLSKSLENYSQEIGRAGRDGAPAICHTFACAEDLRVLENFAYGDTPTAAAVHALLAEIFSAGQSFSVAFYDLAKTHDIRDLVVRTLVTYLELDGYLEGGTPFYSQYKFVPNEPSAKILDRFEGERREFLSRVFSTARKASTWFYLDVEAAAKRSGATRQRVVTALDFLATQGLVKLEVSHVKFSYRRLKEPHDLHALGQELYARMTEREARDIGRLAAMMKLLTEPGCMTRRLTQYFDDSLDADCQICTMCRADGAPPERPAMPQDEALAIEEATRRELEKLNNQHPDVLSDPQVVARFLCGISSPWLVRAKLTRHALFGSCADLPFNWVRQHARGSD